MGILSTEVGAGLILLGLIVGLLALEVLDVGLGLAWNRLMAWIERRARPTRRFPWSDRTGL
jgi:hypothetical protein